jgi:hypothetical protein
MDVKVSVGARKCVTSWIGCEASCVVAEELSWVVDVLSNGNSEYSGGG